MAKVVYNPKAFIPHAASRRQTFVHCARFPVAATRRCMGRVSVPFWGVTLSRPLPVVALVGHYPTNKLIGRRLLLRRTVKSFTRTPCESLQSPNSSHQLKVKFINLKINWKMENGKWKISYEVRGYAVLTPISRGYSPPKGRFLRVTQPFATVPTSRDRSTCMLKARR